MLRDEDIRIDVGCAGNGSGRTRDFIRMVHIPTDISRIHPGPLTGIDQRELQKRWLREIEEEIVAQGKTEFIVPTYSKKSRKQRHH